MRRDARGQILATLFSAVLWWKHWSTLLGRGAPPSLRLFFIFCYKNSENTQIVLVARYLNLPKARIDQQILDKRLSSNNKMRTLPMLDQSTEYKYNFWMTFFIVKQRREAMAILKVNTRVIYSNPLPWRAQKLPYVKLREDINGNRTFTFGQCPKVGGGSPLP